MEKEIEVGNKMIAEFMGYKKRCDRYGADVMAIDGAPVLTLDSKHTKYHKSLDWLYPVICKLWESISEHDQQMKGLVLFELGIATPIGEVYNACIEAIHYYNLNK